MNGVTIAVIVIVVVVVVAVAALLLIRRQQRERQERARREYGGEYERAAEELGSERQAERELRHERERVESEVRPLPTESRERYRSRWEEVERTFVDDPVASLDMADRVVREIMSERNFPAESRQEATREVGVMHSEVSEDFREAQRIHHQATGEAGREEGRAADSEMMRQAIQKYRAVYERLVKD